MLLVFVTTASSPSAAVAATVTRPHRSSRLAVSSRKGEAFHDSAANASSSTRHAPACAAGRFTSSTHGSATVILTTITITLYCRQSRS